LSATEAIQADCDIKAKSIILQGLPPEVYALVSIHKVAKELWERIQLLMQGTSLMKQERELNTKFLNTLPPEWSKFVTDVKLVWDLYKTNIDQLHAYLRQHESHANKLRNSSNPRQQATINDGRVTLQPIQGRQTSFAAGTTRTYTPGESRSNSRKQRTVICYNCKEEGHMSKQCTKSKRKRDGSWFKDKVLLVQAQANGQILHEEELAFLADPGIAEVALMANLSHYGSDALAEVHNPNNMDNNMINQTVQAMLSSEQSIVNQSETEITSDSNIIPHSQYQSAQTVHMLTKPQFFYDHTTKQALGFQNPFYLKKAQQLEPKLYDANVIKNTSAIVIPNSEDTIMLAEESRLKMLLKQKDPMMLEKKVNTTPVDYAVHNQLSQDFKKRFVPQTELSAEQAFWSQNSVNSPKPTLSSKPTKVEVPKKLPKVSMVNMSLKKLKYHLVGFDVVFKERTTPTAITEGSWGFEHTKACFRDAIIPFVKALKDLFNTFDQYLIDELSEVQNV
ncbi:retrovirus-related pol polyprotein from transposon TNT 1-94, partial [Tanacetum coccineum]